MTSSEATAPHPLPPHGISISIDRRPYKAPVTPMTGLQLRALATPQIGSDRDLYLEVPGRGQDQLIADNQEVDLKEGMHFYSAPKTVNPGDVVVQLPEHDERYLTEKGHRWELCPDGQGACLILRDFEVEPSVYDRDKTDLMIRIPAQYNLAGLDMFYVNPSLRLLATNAFPPAAELTENHCGTTWQRFSRHPASPWQPGIDGIATFLTHVHRELQRPDG